MYTTTRNSLIITVLACLASGCGNQTSQPVAQQDNTPVASVQTIGHNPLPTWESAIGYLPDLSPSAQRLMAAEYERFNSAEDNPGVWAIHANDCSWYCGGECENVTASSTLPDQDTNTYSANNAHDLGYNTAWVEGVEGPGIGETLTYTFTNNCPRITKILIHNGYIKSEDVWIKNNRVRTLELSINGEPTAHLSLSDTRAQQSFDLNALGVGPLGWQADGKDLVLAFSILDVYPGTTHDDTAITEIFFDGIDVH